MIVYNYVVKDNFGKYIVKSWIYKMERLKLKLFYSEVRILFIVYVF